MSPLPDHCGYLKAALLFARDEDNKIFSWMRNTRMKGVSAVMFFTFTIVIDQ